jgi:hypothetical protein
MESIAKNVDTAGEHSLHGFILEGSERCDIQILRADVTLVHPGIIVSCIQATDTVNCSMPVTKHI